MTKHAIRLVASLVGVVVVTGVQGTSLAQVGLQTDPLECPEGLRESALSARPVERGVELSFTSATAPQVKLLREELRMLAKVLEHRSRMVPDPREPDTVPIPPLEIMVNDAAFGARLTIHAVRPDDVPGLHALGRGLEDAWVESACGLGPEMRMPSSGIDRPISDEPRLTRAPK
jgi:hypothetical protein